MPSSASRPLTRFPARLRGALAVAAWLAATLVPAPRARAVELIDYGPILAAGYAEKRGRDMGLAAVGWRWRWNAGSTVDGWFRRIGTDFTWLVEPMAAAIAGDEDSVEVQVVPQLHFEPSAMRQRAWSPYLEGGIGLMYTGLDGLGLGSNILFSDNVGLGVRFPGFGWSIGYRYRHISHAGLWAESNSGMNTHYLTVTYAIEAPGPSNAGDASQ